ncbi:unnamed protein product [Clonostachys rosea f. rosea IK726]|uniref:Uncharacterized protein n=2 Tax=Bionectria ochroleuca TaxID=29856 RepID=A0A8H7N0R7_BIOOC|nr:unnamed protein product [Clonostachys rosea f. rosea IK726]
MSSRKRKPGDYAKAVGVHASRSKEKHIFCGANFLRLSLLLKQKSAGRNDRFDGETQYPFVLLHDLAQEPKDTKRIVPFGRPQDLWDFEREVPEGRSSSGLILFVRGYPSADWVNTIGSKYKIDPEIFRVYLTPPWTEDEFFDMPSSVRIASNTITLRIPSIGRCTASTIPSAAAGKSLEQYWKNVKPGDSIVRSYFWHDPELFSIEQHITISVKKRGQGWFILVLVDNGKDLEDCHEGPWFDKDPPVEEVFLPVLPALPGAALDDAASKGFEIPKPPKAGDRKNSIQSASLLGLKCLGRTIDPTQSDADPLLAVHDLFLFAITAEKQFLNMVKTRISMANHGPWLGHDWMLKTLDTMLHHQEILQDHIGYLAEIVDFLENYSQLRWVGVEEAKEQRDYKLSILNREFSNMLRSATTLSRRCQDRISNLRGTVAIMDSRAAYAQAETIGRLTRLAFFFVPLSFLTSFFGMNFVEFGTGTLGIWIFFTICVPMLGISAVLGFMQPLKAWIG